MRVPLSVCARVGIDYTRPAFGPCTSPGVPADTCKVIYAADLYADDGLLDASIFHGTNVAGVVAGETGQWISSQHVVGQCH